tara:strand:- start:237 stop:425 length:189 start_codon:yes stop_codon:yes gene_type:complete
MSAARWRGLIYAQTCACDASAFSVVNKKLQRVSSSAVSGINLEIVVCYSAYPTIGYTTVWTL